MPAIGEVARQTGLKIPTIRFYEAEGLLAAPARGANGRRQYREPDIRRLSFIRHARDLGFELGDVRSLLDLTDHPERPCGQADAIAQRHLDAVEERIAQLNELKKELSRIVRSCAGGRTAGRCNVIEALAGSEPCAPHEQVKNAVKQRAKRK